MAMVAILNLTVEYLDCALDQIATRSTFSSADLRKNFTDKVLDSTGRGGELRFRGWRCYLEMGVCGKQKPGCDARAGIRGPAWEETVVSRGCLTTSNGCPVDVRTLVNLDFCRGRIIRIFTVPLNEEELAQQSVLTI
jgi:hypothetical protein